MVPRNSPAEFRTALHWDTRGDLINDTIYKTPLSTRVRGSMEDGQTTTPGLKWESGLTRLSFVPHTTGTYDRTEQ